MARGGNRGYRVISLAAWRRRTSSSVEAATLGGKWSGRLLIGFATGLNVELGLSLPEVLFETPDSGISSGGYTRDQCVDYFVRGNAVRLGLKTED